jgi:hypothetical protein
MASFFTNNLKLSCVNLAAILVLQLEAMLGTSAGIITNVQPVKSMKAGSVDFHTVCMAFNFRSE